MHAGFKGQAGTGGILFEHHHQRTVAERVVGFVVLEFALDDTGAFNDVLEFIQR